MERPRLAGNQAQPQAIGAAFVRREAHHGGAAVTAGMCCAAPDLPPRCRVVAHGLIPGARPPAHFDRHTFAAPRLDDVLRPARLPPLPAAPAAILYPPPPALT